MTGRRLREMKFRLPFWRRFVGARPRRSQAGSSMVEFALVATLFFTLMFGIIDLGRLFFAQMTLQHALRQAGRFAVTGNHDPDGGGPLPSTSRITAIKNVATTAAAGLDLNSIQISSLSDVTDSSSSSNNYAGAPGWTVVISLTSNIRLFTPLISKLVGMPGGLYTFTASTTFRNEPFDPSKSN